MTNDIRNATVRFPVDLHARIVASAQADHRSLSGQILTLIEEALAARSAT
jgi:hypothetical protein